MKKIKKQYQMPVVIDYGAVTELTKGAHLTNKDTPNGAPSTAYS